MASLIIQRPDGEDEVGLWTAAPLVFDAPVLYVSSTFLLTPPGPWEVHNLTGGRDRLDLANVTIRLPAVRPRPDRIWKLTGQPHDGPQGMFQAAWPD